MSHAEHRLDETPIVDRDGYALMGMLYGSVELNDGQITAITLDHAAQWSSDERRWIRSGKRTRMEPPDRSSTPYERALWTVLSMAVERQYGNEIADTAPRIGTDDLALAPVRL